MPSKRVFFRAVSAPARVRACSLIALGALLVHDLRYALEFHGDWREALAEQGHAYLSLIVPLVAVALAGTGCLFLVELRRARRAQPAASPPPRARSFWVSWLATSVILSAIYVGQELAEGYLASDHATGLAGVVGGEGWTAFVLAFALGGVIAYLLRRAEAAVMRAGRRGRVVWQVLDFSTVTPPVRYPRPLDAVARHLAGRGPPTSA